MQHDVPILTPELGINVNDKHQAFTDQILSGAKTTETRSAPTLHPYIGKKMGLVRTGKGKAMLVGYVTIGEPKLYTAESSFDSDFDSHLVGKDSPFHISKSKKGSKWGYTLSDVEKVEPRLLKDGTGVAPNPRVARRLQKIADHVRVKLARVLGKRPTAESFGNLWHMTRTEPNHYKSYATSGGSFRGERSNVAAPRPNVYSIPSHQELVNDPTILHFVAHHPDQASSVDFPTDNSNPVTFSYINRNMPGIPLSSMPWDTGFEEINPQYSHKEMIDQVSRGQSSVARLLGVKPSKYSNEVQPTVYFKSHQAAKLASMLSGGHVESVAFHPREAAKTISETQRGVRTWKPPFYDLRDRPESASQGVTLPAGGLRLSANVILQHPVFGEYITKLGDDVSNTNAADYHWIDPRNTHRRMSLESNGHQPDGNVIRDYGHPPTHFDPGVLDDTGKELHSRVVANPGDHLARAVLADHLDNMGHHEHADNWRQTLPLKFAKKKSPPQDPRVARKLQNAASPVRYAADQDEPSKFTMPSTNPASTSFGTAKNWVKLNDPHPIWHNQRGGEHNIGVVDHLSHGDERLSAIHFVAGHPAQMSPVSFLDPSSDYPAQMKVMGVLSPHLKESSSAFPVARYNFHSNGETSHAPGRYQTGTMLGIRGDERDFSRQVYNSALSTNRAVLENLGITSNVTVNGQDLHSRFTPMFKDREAAERMAKHVGGYVQTIHFDPSRLRARGKPIEEAIRNWYGYEPGMADIHDPDQFQVIDSRDNPSTQRLDGSIVNIAKHPSYGEYLVTHNQSHLTSGPSFMRDTHFAGSLDKIDRQTFGSERYRDNLSNPTNRNFYQKENRKNYFTPFISQYWRNLIDLHSDFHNNDFGGRRDLSAVLNNAGIDHTPPTRQLIDSMGDDARHLYAMALADHNEHTPRVILADLFDEHGHEGAANFMRASVPNQASGQVKLAKDSKPDANWQPRPGAPVEVVSEIPGVWSTSGVYGGHADTPGKHVIEKTEGKYKGQEREIPEHRIYAPGGFAHMGPSVARSEIAPETQQPAQQAKQPSLQRGDPITFRQYNGQIYEATYGRPISENESGASGEDWHEVHKKGEGDSPTWIQRGDINPDVTPSSAAQPATAQPQNSDAWHPKSGESVRIMGSDGQISSHGVHYVYERPHADRNMHSVSVRTASGTILGEDRTAANTIYHPTIDAHLGQPLPRQLTPEQVADAHFNVGDDVHIRRGNGRIDTGTYRRINLTPSGDVEHVVSLGGNSGSGDVAVSPEDVWHWRGASSTHKAFTGPSSWGVVNNTIKDASPGRRIWVNTGFRDKGMKNSAPEFLNQYRRATLVNVNQDGTMSVRLDGGKDAMSVSPARVRDNTDQSHPHVDTFNGSPISVIDTAGGEIYHGVYRGMARQSEGGQSVRSAIADAGLPYGENWTDPNRGSERFIHVAEINTPDGPLPVAVERSDILPRFAQGITHNELNEDPRSAKGTLLKVASSFESQGLAPDAVISMRERAARLGTKPVRAINPPAFGSSTKAAPDKKLERIIFNADERNYQDVADSLRDKFREIFGENVDDETIMDVLRVPRAFPGADPNHPAFSPENLELSASIYGDNVSSTVKSKLPNYKFHASTSVGSNNASNRSQSHSGARGTHDKFISTPHILQNQANAAHRLGIDHLGVSAALSNPVIDPHNGYTGGIVWPTYGYRKDLHAINDWDEIQLGEAIAIARRNNPDLHSVDDDDLTLNHLLDSKEGLDWYTQHEPHKNGGKYYPNVTDGHMEFDTNPNSISHRILARKTRRLEQNAASQRKPS